MAADYSAMLLLIALCCLLQTSLANVVVTGNPHVPPPSPDVCPFPGNEAPDSCSQALFIDPSRVIAAPAPLQADTFSHVQRVRYLDAVVPVSAALPRCCLASHSFTFPLHCRYHFRQPERLSHLQLPFKIVLVNAPPSAALRAVAVDPRDAADSWFIGYSWSLLLCGSPASDGCDSETHLGWRYTSASGDVFYALIVAFDEDAAAATSVSALPVVVPSSIRFGIPRSSAAMLL